MGQVQFFISNQKLVSVSPESFVSESIKKMVEAKIGTTLVLEKGRLRGVFSERDLIKRVLAHDLDIRTTPVKSVMTTKVKSVRRGVEIYDCLKIMKEYKCRSLPVVMGWNTAIGIITIIDALNDLTTEIVEWKKDLASFNLVLENAKFAPYINEPLRLLAPPHKKLEKLSSKATVRDAVNLMATANLGCALIMDDDKLLGVFSERDIITKVFAQGLDVKLEKLPIKDFMTKKVFKIDVNSSTIECLKKMKKIGSRNLPVERDGVIVAVVSIINCLNWLFDEYTYYESLGVREFQSKISAEFREGIKTSLFGS